MAWNRKTALWQYLETIWKQYTNYPAGLSAVPGYGSLCSPMSRTQIRARARSTTSLRVGIPQFRSTKEKLPADKHQAGVDAAYFIPGQTLNSSPAQVERCSSKPSN